MTKQEEIRDVIADIVWKQTMALLGGDSDIIGEIDTGNFMYGKVAATKILTYLHSQGVVIKGQCLGGSHPHLSAYYTVEPLIKK